MKTKDGIPYTVIEADGKTYAVMVFDSRRAPPQDMYQRLASPTTKPPSSRWHGTMQAADIHNGGRQKQRKS